MRKAAALHAALELALEAQAPRALLVEELDGLVGERRDLRGEGERETQIEDVLPLCASCHRAAHSETPPIPIDRLKVMELWKE